MVPELSNVTHLAQDLHKPSNCMSSEVSAIIQARSHRMRMKIASLGLYVDHANFATFSRANEFHGLRRSTRTWIPMNFARNRIREINERLSAIYHRLSISRTMRALWVAMQISATFRESQLFKTLRYADSVMWITHTHNVVTIWKPSWRKRMITSVSW